MCIERKTGALEKPLNPPENILKHFTSLYSAIAFFMSTQLDVFKELKERPKTTEEAAEARDLNPSFMERPLYALEAADNS